MQSVFIPPSLSEPPIPHSLIPPFLKNDQPPTVFTETAPSSDHSTFVPKNLFLRAFLGGCSYFYLSSFQEKPLKQTSYLHLLIDNFSEGKIIDYLEHLITEYTL